MVVWKILVFGVWCVEQVVLVYIEFNYEFWLVFYCFQFKLNQVDQCGGQCEEQKLRYIYIKVKMLVYLVNVYGQYSNKIGYWAFSQYVYFNLEVCQEKILLWVFGQGNFFEVVLFLVGEDEVVDVKENEQVKLGVDNVGFEV